MRPYSSVNIHARCLILLDTVRQVGTILRQLCRQKGVDLLEGHAMPDHIHLVLSIPPKYSVAMVVGYLKGKSAIQIHRRLLGVNRGLITFHPPPRQVTQGFVRIKPVTMDIATRSYEIWHSAQSTVRETCL